MVSGCQGAEIAAPRLWAAGVRADLGGAGRVTSRSLPPLKLEGERFFGYALAFPLPHKTDVRVFHPSAFAGLPPLEEPIGRDARLTFCPPRKQDVYKQP